MNFGEKPIERELLPRLRTGGVLFDEAAKKYFGSHFPCCCLQYIAVKKKTKNEKWRCLFPTTLKVGYRKKMKFELSEAGGDQIETETNVAY